VDATKPWLGIASAKNDDGRAKITNVLPGSPAEAAGLSKDDVIIAIDDRSINSDDLSGAVALHKPGDTLKISLIRLGELRNFNVTLGSNPYATYTLKPAENPTDSQKQIYKSWLGIK